MPYFIAATLLIVGVIHLLPVIGVISSAARVSRLYGVVVDEPNLELLLRHRAALFALVGGFLVFAASSRATRLRPSSPAWSAWCRFCGWPS